MVTRDFAGNKRALELLGSLLESGRLPHAILIEGESGLGKKTLARLLASALVCRGENRPCMECAQCRKSSKGIHPDIIEYIPSGSTNSFKVDMVREVIRDAYMQPNEADYKVYILAEAHCMNASAQNALLKILEEPPEYAVFILTAESKSAMLDTVLSRSYTVSLEGVTPDDGASLICSRLESADYDTVKSLVETFNGNIGKALEGLSDSKSDELVSTCSDICRAIIADREYELLKACGRLPKDRQAAVLLCTLLKNIFRDALIAGDGVGYTSGQQELASLLRQRLSRQKLANLIETSDELRRYALTNANSTLLNTKICYSLRRAVGR